MDERPSYEKSPINTFHFGLWKSSYSGALSPVAGAEGLMQLYAVERSVLTWSWCDQNHIWLTMERKNCILYGENVLFVNTNQVLEQII